MVGGGEGDSQLWRSGRGAIAGCHCSVLWLGGWVTNNFAGVDVVPLQGALLGEEGDVVPFQGAIVVCYGWGEGDWYHYSVPL